MVELEIVERWQHSQDVEVFYNSKLRRLVFKKFKFMYSKDVDQQINNPYLDLQGYG
jgi:hypothetical protein